MNEKSIDNAPASGKTYGDYVTAHALYAKLRREDPLHWTEPDGFRPFWAVSKHSDVVDISRQGKRFINAPRERLLSVEFENKVKEVMAGKPFMTKSMHLFNGAD